MNHLHKVLAERVALWREEGYACEQYPAISEILTFAVDEERDNQLRYLRAAQFRALETYWYLRLLLDTPKIPDLYEKLFNTRQERLAAMGVSSEAFGAADFDEKNLIELLQNDQAFVRKYKLESLRETFTLDYPSYILALAMGAGKTILIGTIMATEFAMAREYPDANFVENALIFAPGKTIIESLREIADIPFDSILPPRMYSPFAASLKLTFTRDGEKDLPVIRGSSWNVVVTNTEKIRIQKPTGKRDSGQLRLAIGNKDEQAEEIANLRLQAIASLPHLAVFSDEAHHTYGQSLDKELKKVRKTVDYLASATNVICVVNTTGTPYFKRQPLRDVVIWYGLGEGVRDGVLKDVARNIKVFDLEEDLTGDLIREVVKDFASDYWKVTLPNGAPARLAMYFPNTAAVGQYKPHVEAALAENGLDASVVLEVNNKSSEKVKTEFYRVASDSSSPYRVLLLVNMGTEGWNCPSLFACALVRKLGTSNNFVLQAATRCLRQVPGNNTSARIYLAKSNRKVLEDQLKETYGTTIKELNDSESERVEKIIELRKPELPPLLIKKRTVRFRRKQDTKSGQSLVFIKPDVPYTSRGSLESWMIIETDKGETKLTRQAEDHEIYGGAESCDVWTASAILGANYHLLMQTIYVPLRAIYGAEDIPEHHIPLLGEQIEQQMADYEQYEEVIDVAVALVKPDGFLRQLRNGKAVYTARVSFAKDREHLYKMAGDFGSERTVMARNKSFHYEGYNFDSEPEAAYLEEVLNLIEHHADNIEGVWFTGGITDPAKTDLYAEYLGEDNRWHRYTPDFVIRRKDGKHLIVEIKKDAFKADIRADLERHAKGEAPQTQEGRKAVALQRWQDLNPAELHYEVAFADGLPLPNEALKLTREFLAEKAE